MSDIFRSLANKLFAALLIALGLDAASLFVMFNFVAASEIGTEAGLVLFVLSAILLILGYAVGIVVAGFLAILVLTRFWNRTRKTGNSN